MFSSIFEHVQFVDCFLFWLRNWNIRTWCTMHTHSKQGIFTQRTWSVSNVNGDHSFQLFVCFVLRTFKIDLNIPYLRAR